MTDTIFPNDSCHPQEHKRAAIRYLVNRMNTYKLNTTTKEKENDEIKHILRNNIYHISIISRFNKTKSKEKHIGSSLPT